MPNPLVGVPVTGNADQVRTGPGRILMAPYTSTLVLPSTYDEALASGAGGFLEVGYTTEGSELSVSQESDGVVVAERLREIRREVTGGAATYSFTFAQMNPLNLSRATNAPAGNTVVSTNTVRFNFPKIAGDQRWSIVWESIDGLERLVIAKCYSTGTITVPRRKGVDIAGQSCEFTVEDVGSATDPNLYMLFDRRLIEPAYVPV